MILLLKGCGFMPKVIPICDLQNTSEISSMCNSSADPIFITKDGFSDMVIMSVKTYEEKLFFYDVYKKLDEAETDISLGNTSPAYDSLKKLKAKYNV